MRKTKGLQDRPTLSVSLDPERTDAILKQARQMRASVIRRLATRLFWLPVRLWAPLAPQLKQALSWSQPDFH